jgi:hypothetical protein
VGGEDDAVEDDAVAGSVGRQEVAIADPDGLGQRAEVGKRAAVDVLEDTGIRQGSEVATIYGPEVPICTRSAGELRHDLPI